MADHEDSCRPELVTALASLNIETIRLARALMIAQEEADVLGHVAGEAIDAAADDPDDGDLIDTALAAAAEASEAAEVEMQMAQEWGGHIETVNRLVDRAALANAGPAPRLPRLLTSTPLGR
jgi:hypothetical protein